ncbi:hypothetical protein GCM10010869_34880 [Mesorhizobium tianshanense]|nr:hypothetical protein GCM10010869_34880 [Mesorhizobium tianshanense]
MQAGSCAPKQPKKGHQGPIKPAADKDACWGKKGRKSTFGYKMHIGVDQEHTLIGRVEASDASVTDTEPADALISGDEKAAYGDQAYYTHARHARLVGAGIKDRLMRRPNKHHPELPPRHKLRNRMIAKVRGGGRAAFRRVQGTLRHAALALLQPRHQPHAVHASRLRLQSADHDRRPLSDERRAGVCPKSGGSAA